MSRKRSNRTMPARQGGSKRASGVHAIIQALLLLTLLTPLLVSDWFLFPDVTPKVLCFQLLTELAAGATIIAFLTQRKRRTSELGVITPTMLAAAGFLLASFVSGLLGMDLTRSLWGFIERQDGLILLGHFLIWMVILDWTARRNKLEPQQESVMVRPRFARNAVILSFGVSVVVALSILVEAYRAPAAGERFVLWRMLESQTRPGGVFGNPTLAGPYLLFHFFWGLYTAYAIARKLLGSARPGRSVWAGYLALVCAGECLIVFAILAGQTRGVFLGLAAGVSVVVLAASMARSAPRPLRVTAAAGVLLLVVSGGIVWQYRDTETLSRISLIQRLTRLSPQQDTATMNRLLVWRGSLNAFTDRPVFGWGPRNIYYALNKYYDPRHVQFTLGFNDPTETWHDKSHNAYLDLLAEGGLLVFAAFILLAAVVVRGLWRMSDRPLAICLSGALSGYAVSNFFAFDGFGALLGLFMALATVSLYQQPMDLASLAGKAGDRASRRTAQPGAGPTPLALQLAAVAACVVLIVFLYLNVSIARAANGYVNARRAFEYDPGLAITRYEESFRYFSPYDAAEKIKCAYMTVNAAIAKRPSSRSFDAGSLVVNLAAEALRKHPQDAHFYLLLNDMYNGLAMYGDRRLTAEAERFGKRALELSPRRQEVMFTLGRTYIIKGESARAVEINQRMLQEYPDFPLGHWLLGLSYLSNKQRDEARKEILLALQKGYRLQNQQEIDTVKQLMGEKELAPFLPK